MPVKTLKPQMLDVGPLASNAKHEMKDSLLTVLNKLGERDTQQKAHNELSSIVRVRELLQPTSLHGGRAVVWEQH